MLCAVRTRRDYFYVCSCPKSLTIRASFSPPETLIFKEQSGWVFTTSRSCGEASQTVWDWCMGKMCHHTATAWKHRAFPSLLVFHAFGMMPIFACESTLHHDDDDAICGGGGNEAWIWGPWSLWLPAAVRKPSSQQKNQELKGHHESNTMAGMLMPLYFR